MTSKILIIIPIIIACGIIPAFGIQLVDPDTIARYYDVDYCYSGGFTSLKNSGD